MSKTIIGLVVLTILVAALRLSGLGGAGADEARFASGEPPKISRDEPSDCAMCAAEEAEHTSACCDEPAGCETCAAKSAGQKPDSAKIKEAIAALPAEDRSAAEKQQTCPVSDAALGAMGKPPKITVQERDVFLCCEACKEAVMNDPEKYLAKLAE